VSEKGDNRLSIVKTSLQIVSKLPMLRFGLLPQNVDWKPWSIEQSTVLIQSFKFSVNQFIVIAVIARHLILVFGEFKVSERRPGFQVVHLDTWLRLLLLCLHEHVAFMALLVKVGRHFRYWAQGVVL